MKKIVCIFVCMLFFNFVFSTVVIADNSPPNPPLIEGPTTGNIGKSYSYNITLTDPDVDDQMFYLEVDFGDGIVHEDCGCGKAWQNGEIITVSHSWKKAGNYSVTARVQDGMGEWSEWSDPLAVSMPKNKVTNLFILLSDACPKSFPFLERVIGLLEQTLGNRWFERNKK